MDKLSARGFYTILEIMIISTFILESIITSLI